MISKAVVIVALACQPLLASCKAGHSDAGREDRIAQTAAEPAAPNVPARPTPDALADTNEQDGTPKNAQQVIDENNRKIAENQKEITVLGNYSRQDSQKLDRLVSQCQEKLGVSFENGGAKQIVDCVRGAW